MLVLFFIADPIWIIIGSFLGLAFSGMLMFVDGASWFSVGFSFVFYVVAGIIIIWRINKLSQ
jgi:hypothetical protein